MRNYQNPIWKMLFVKREFQILLEAHFLFLFLPWQHSDNASFIKKNGDTILFLNFHSWISNWKFLGYIRFMVYWIKQLIKKKKHIVSFVWTRNLVSQSHQPFGRVCGVVDSHRITKNPNSVNWSRILALRYMLLSVLLPIYQTQHP